MDRSLNASHRSHHHHAASESHATHLSLRGPHPLTQNPPSIAEDQSEYASFDDVDIDDPIIRLPPSALTAATAYNPHEPSPLDDYSPVQRFGHQRSLTGTLLNNCQPFLNRATSTLQQHTSKASLPSPTKSLASFIPSRSAIESTASQPKIRAGAKALQSWFNGASAPVSLGVPSTQEDADSGSDDYYDSEEDEEPNMMANIFNRTPTLTRSTTEPSSKPTTPTPAKQQGPTAGSKFSWILNTQKNAALPPPVPSPTYHDPSDELLNLNISQSLFPHGPVDPLAPSSFHDLLSTAESLLTRYQTSYRQVSSALVDARAEAGAQEDELDEAETRVRHFKMQLETMAERASQQDAQMRKLMEELAIERRARQEEEAARKRSLALIRGPALQHLAQEEEHGGKQRHRISNSEISVDSGFESECDSEAASIFSRRNCMSPTDTLPSSAASFLESEVDTTPKGKKPQTLLRRSTYDKVREGSVDLTNGGWGCTNCEGGAQSSVWGRLAREREESSILRRRVEQLEDVVESALNVVDGPWGM